MNMEIIDRLVKEKIKHRSEMEKQISVLENQVEKSKEKVRSAFEAADKKAYKDAKNDLQEYESELEITRHLYERDITRPVLTDEEASSIWSEFSSEHDNLFDKMYSDFEKKRNEMLVAYQKLVDLQTEAIITRERLAEYVGKGVVYRYSIWDRPYDALFPCKFLPTESKEGRLTMSGTIVRNPDALFYLASAADNESEKGLPYIENHNLHKVMGIISKQTIKFQ